MQETNRTSWFKVMHFKHGNSGMFSEEEMQEFEKNIENYYEYTHFMLVEYRGHLLHRLSVPSPSEEQVNRTQVIEYFAGDAGVVMRCTIPYHLPFEVGVKYEIGELIMFALSSETKF